MPAKDLPDLSAFRSITTDKIRYADTDRQGHVNNAAFSSFLESGRVEIIYDPDHPLASPGCAFVIASLALDFFNEITWPGIVDIGTRVARLGRSSIHLEQAIFQDGRCTAIARTVIVQMDESSRRSSPLSDIAVKTLARLKIDGGG